MEEIHVSWQGEEKPAPSDLSGLLSVRRRVVERALVWLKKNNPHYAEIEIDAAEMEAIAPSKRNGRRHWTFPLCLTTGSNFRPHLMRKQISVPVRHRSILIAQLVSSTPCARAKEE
ncbi:hypothetical protein EDB80DRAFT_263535 [Ilyonectria destructans]|nr:hypothetical protein EDB80DRAFT_263535 [Ilyonectria destructans]